jgi:hypothetical protein
MYGDSPGQWQRSRRCAPIQWDFVQYSIPSKADFTHQQSDLPGVYPGRTSDYDRDHSHVCSHRRTQILIGTRAGKNRQSSRRHSHNRNRGSGYEVVNQHYPDTLSDVGYGEKLDPWGSLYQYLNFATTSGIGAMRKDRFLVPINTYFDLYSTGEDGESVSPLSAMLTILWWAFSTEQMLSVS